MEKQTIEIKSINEKEGKNGKPYWVVSTQEGGITCFDSGIIDKLKGEVGKFAEVGIKESNGFKNIREFHCFVENNNSEKIPEEQVLKPASPSETKGLKDNRRNSFNCAYAKDLAINISQVEQHLDITRDGKYWEDKARQACKQLNIILDTFGGV